MKKEDVLGALERLGKDRQWLAEVTGYTYDYVKNTLAKSAAEPSRKFTDLCERAFLEEERRREVDITRPGASVWDLVYFNGSEMAKIDRAKKAGGYDALPALYKDAVIHFADHLLAEDARRGQGFNDGSSDSALTREPAEGRVSFRPQGGVKHWIDLRGGIAAGSPISAHVVEEPIPVGKEYPEDHYALRVFGQSMEPKIPDGSTIIVKAWPANNGAPKKGSIVVYSDAMGSTLKVFGYRKAKAGEESDAMGNVPVLKSLNPTFPDVQTLDGGKIDAVFVEVA